MSRLFLAISFPAHICCAIYKCYRYIFIHNWRNNSTGTSN